MITEEDKDKLIATLTLQLQEKEKESLDIMRGVVGFARKRELMLLEKVQDLIDEEVYHVFQEEIEKRKTDKYVISYEQSQNQTAIAELEKLKEFMSDYRIDRKSVLWKIDQQIRVLKGEE